MTGDGKISSAGKFGPTPAVEPPEAVRKAQEPKTPPRDPQGRFPSGQSGNPTGRPKGSRNRINQIVEKWAEKNLEPLLAILPHLAVNDAGLMKFVLGRVTPKEWLPAPDFAFGSVTEHFAIKGILEQAFSAYDAGEIDQEALKGVIKVLQMVKTLNIDPPSEEGGKEVPFA